MPYPSVYEKLAAEIATGGSAYDVATIDVVWLPAFADFAEPLDALITDEVVADIFPALLADGLWNGSYIGMPTWANAEVIYYRKDLWGDAEEQAAFMAEYGYELAPPTNWQEFTDMAVFFTRDTDGDGAIDLYGTDVKGAPPGADVEWMVHVLQAGSPGVVLDAEGGIIVDNDAHVAGLEYYVSHHCDLGVTPPNPLEIGWAEGENLFFQGATAMMRFWGHAYRLHQFDLAGGLVGAEYLGPEAVANVGVAPMIAGEAGIGAIPGPWFNIVPQGSGQQGSGDGLREVHVRAERAGSAGAAGAVRADFGLRAVCRGGELREPVRADYHAQRPADDRPTAGGQLAAGERRGGGADGAGRAGLRGNAGGGTGMGAQ